MRLRLPCFVSRDLGLAQAGKVIGYGLLRIEAKVSRVSANESLIKDAAGKIVEVFLFDGAEHPRADLDNVGNVIEREFFLLARLAKLISEVTHEKPPAEMETS